MRSKCESIHSVAEIFLARMELAISEIEANGFGDMTRESMQGSSKGQVLK